VTPAGHAGLNRELVRRHLGHRELAAVVEGGVPLAGLLHARLELRVLDVRLLLGRAGEVAAAAQRLAAACDEDALPELAGESLGLLAEASLMLSRYAEMDRASRRAMEICRRIGDKAGEASRCNALGVALEDTGRPEQGLDCYRRALALYRALGDADGVGRSLVNIATVTGGLGSADEAERTFLEAIATLERGTDLVNLAFAHSNYSVLLARLGRWEERRRHLEESRRIRERIGDRYGLGFSLSNMACDLLRQGSWQEGERMLADAIALRRSIGERKFLAGDLASLGALRREQLRLEEARMLLQQAAAMARELADGRLGAIALLRLALVHCDQERWAEAESRLDEAAAAEPSSSQWPAARLAAARCAAARGGQAQAMALLDGLLDSEGGQAGPWRTEACLALAAAMAAGGQAAGAKSQFERAVELARSDQGVYHLGVALFRLGEWGKQEGQTWGEPLARAEEIFSRLGATAWLERISLLRMS